MKKAIKRGVFVALIFLVAFLLFGLTQYTMVRTSNPQFCTTCHEMRFAYDTWKTSTHVNNEMGLVAECMDCHLPPLHETLNFYTAKIYHGVKDVVLHFTQDTYDHEKNRQIVYKTFDNGFCLRCHRNFLFIPDKRGAMLSHRSVIYARSGYEKKCTDCHMNLVHKPRDIYRYR